MRRRWFLAAPLLAISAGLGGCSAAPGPAAAVRYRVSSNPYAGLDWDGTLRLTVQLHDHVGVDTAGLRAYDRAGYDAMSLMSYSGAPALPYAWTSRRWPPDQWLPPSFIGNPGRIRQFIPNGEEVGAAHVVSPFLTTFISRVGPSTAGLPADALYTTTQECIDAIRRHGGLAFLAHPWVPVSDLLALRDYNGIEIYSAFARYRDEVIRDPALPAGERGRLLLAAWDSLLVRNPSVFGIAVNDHHGPASNIADLPVTIRDSGKVLVFAADTTGTALKEALRTGRFVAVADLGAVKGRYPSLQAVVVSDSAIVIATEGEVRWLGAGGEVAAGPRFALTARPAGLTYVRVEIRNPEGSVVYTQAFGLAEL